MNKEWHTKNKMPERATMDQRVRRHQEHAPRVRLPANASDRATSHRPEVMDQLIDGGALAQDRCESCLRAPT